MKGNSSCHIPNDKFREGWDRTFRKEPAPDGVVPDNENLYQKRTTKDEEDDRGFWP
jgi:hypothetical protein